MLDLGAYFDRIRYGGSGSPSLDTLQALHHLHPMAIPFENLDTLFRRPVLLDSAALQHKLIGCRRGGYCFEQNLLFSRVLEALGYRVSALAARVLWDASNIERPYADLASRPRTHMLLLVELEDGTYLGDVGFGGLTLTAPLRLELGVEQVTPHEVFRIVADDPALTLEAKLGVVWKPLYCFDLQRQLEIDIEVLNHFVSTHRSSPFLTTLMAARAAPERRYGLRNNELTVRYAGEAAERQVIASVTELRDVLRDTFGISVPDDDACHAALRGVVGA